MTRWWAAVLQDTAGPDAALPYVREQAARESAVLRCEVPTYGWVARHRRDGKLYPCSDSMRGAMPAWIWYGDTEDVPKRDRRQTTR